MDFNTGEPNEPYIGVHVSPKRIDKLTNQKAGKKINRLQKMSKIAKVKIFYFSERDVDFKKKLINGMFYNGNTKKWSAETFPLPDVYYSRRGEKKANKSAQRVKSLIDEMDIPKINSERYYHKWHSYEQLNKFEELRPHLPQTVYFRKAKNLQDMFRDSSTLYLKSFRQNNGAGIMRVTKKEAGYEYKYYKNKKIETGSLDTFEELLTVIRLFYQGKGFIIQKSIDLLQYNNKPLDLRCDVQRNGKGELECVAHSVRVGAANSHITNTRSKPEIHRFEAFFQKNLGYTPEEFNKLKARLEKLLCDVFEKVEITHGSFGEIGIDIGIDKNQHLWLIECNMKPGKNSMWVYDKKTINRAYLNPLEYAKYLLKSRN
ncbi:YheC/YheD family endospore coat-associated protein [Virgibacillus senegalensis]|uniref:YheC/YheD family endospore coat-associated protein n=1 Tax=Virgibacillus senegalensis TaxID=1499679 RepID=UPI00069FCEAE|nr:YheC/YheD family protein [Virgibacillus senegalensis]